MSSHLLEGVAPELVWERFVELTRIPRPPKEEEQVRAHVLAWAEERELAAEVDAAGNVVVRVSATLGREEAEPVVLQAHLDMVCERDPGSPNDPREGRIELALDGDWLLATGTTLGADNGIGVAAALAAAEDPDMVHGPLELLLTVSEEQGLEGAKALDPSFVSGGVLLNLDGTSDGALTVGCAGSIHTFTRAQLPREPAADGHVTLAVELSGARGGHSGGDIARGRANAIKALGRVLSHAHSQAPFGLVRLDGGVSRNALPREASAAVTLDARSEPAFRAAAEQELARVCEQFAGSDDGLALSIERAPAEPATDEHTTTAALDLLGALPSGVVAMSPTLPAAVETSTSLNVATTEGETLTLAAMTRSSNAAALDDVAATIFAASRLAGAETEVRRSYPPWQPDLESPLLKTAAATYARLFGDDPALEVVHGGLECAVIGEKVPGIRMLSLGPTIVGPHAPGERVSISSTQRFHRLLGALLDDLSQ